MENLKIKVSVANRVYPLTINREDEENVRKAVKMIENRLKVYEKNFEARDAQDLLSMCLLEVSIKLLNDEHKIKIDTDIQDQLVNLEALIDKQL